MYLLVDANLQPARYVLCNIKCGASRMHRQTAGQRHACQHSKLCYQNNWVVLAFGESVAWHASHTCIYHNTVLCYSLSLCVINDHWPHSQCIGLLVQPNTCSNYIWSVNDLVGANTRPTPTSTRCTDSQHNDEIDM